jgi:hypothetical protein
MPDFEVRQLRPDNRALIDGQIAPVDDRCRIIDLSSAASADRCFKGNIFFFACLCCAPRTSFLRCHRKMFHVRDCHGA